VVGQAEFLANSQKEARTQIAAGLLEQFERVPILPLQRRTGKPNDHDGLLLVANFNDALLLLWKRGRRQLLQCFCAAVPGGKLLFNSALGNRRVNVAKDGQDTILWRGQLLMELF